jgi:hypothetical protein
VRSAFCSLVWLQALPLYSYKLSINALNSHFAALLRSNVENIAFNSLAYAEQPCEFLPYLTDILLIISLVSLLYTTTSVFDSTEFVL